MTRFRKLRQAKRLSQSELAKAVNVDQTAVSKWETGKSFPDIAVAIRVAEYFRVSVDYLLGLDEKKKEPATSEDDGLNEQFLKAIDGLTEKQLDAVIAMIEAFQQEQ